MSYQDEQDARIERLNQLDKMKAQNNPRNLPTGHFTGRCRQCGSDDLWDDNLHYGCNCCGAFLA